MYLYENFFFKVTGGAGFMDSNLIERLLKEANYKIISLDNFSSGFKKTLYSRFFKKTIISQIIL